MPTRSSAKSAPVVFEPEYLDGLKELFERKVVFNHTLGLKITDIQPTVVLATIAMRDDLVGHYSHGRIHGGVISACLDTMGAMACMVNAATRHMDETPVKRLERFHKLGTIDLRVDYLRPGLGTHFHIRAESVRVGSRVGNARIEFTAPDGLLISTGTGAYILS